MNPCDHPEEWISLTGRCLRCNTQVEGLQETRSEVAYPSHLQALHSQRHQEKESELLAIREACPHRFSWIFYGHCTLCGKYLSEAERIEREGAH